MFSTINLEQEKMITDSEQKEVPHVKNEKHV